MFLPTSKPLPTPIHTPSAMRGAERTLAVLRALNAANGSTVSALAEATAISRPALYRILDSMCVQGYVRRREDGDRYELTALVRTLSDGYRDDDWVTQAAVPVMRRLQQEIVWPTDLASFHDNAMYLRETTRSRSPLTIDGVAVGVRLPMLATSSGRAYLAFCEEAERQAILTNLRLSGRPEDARAKDKRYVASLLALTRKQGYGERCEDIFPKTSAIAIPITLGRRIVACLNITFIASVLTPKEAARRYLASMQVSAREIEQQARRVDAG